MSIDPTQAPKTITHGGRVFTIVIERVASVEVAGPRVFPFWRVDTPGQRPYLGPSVTGHEDTHFFEKLVATALWAMTQRG